MNRNGETQQRNRVTIPVAVALLVFGAACGNDSTTSGTAGAGGTGGSAGGETGGSGGETGGTSGSGGTAGSGGSGGIGGSAGQPSDGGIPDPRMTFFVTSDTSMTGNLGGLVGADSRCQRLARAVGRPNAEVWHAYLSIETGDAEGPINARDRMPLGAVINSKGVMIADSRDALHARSGDAELFIDENGAKIPGQWAGSPSPVQHDVLTGSNADGTVMAGQTCRNWTSEDMADTAQVGHTDGLGPSMNPAPPYNSWNSSHANGGCNDTAPRGGAGRLYCFRIGTAEKP